MLQATEVVKSILEKQNNAICDVYAKSNTKVDGKTKQKEKLLHKDVPCRISFEAIPTADMDGHVAVKSQTIKLFLAPEITLPAGCKIQVTHHGISTLYEQSGEPAVRSVRQEVLLKMADKYA